MPLCQVGILRVLLFTPNLIGYIPGAPVAKDFPDGETIVSKRRAFFDHPIFFNVRKTRRTVNAPPFSERSALINGRI